MDIDKPKMDSNEIQDSLVKIKQKFLGSIPLKETTGSFMMEPILQKTR